MGMCSDFSMGVTVLGFLFFFLLWRIHKADKRVNGRGTLPPPDRSTVRSGEMMDRAARRNNHMERRG